VAFAETSDLALSLTQQVVHSADCRPVGMHRLRRRSADRLRFMPS
jgi:hypothetical protein